MDERILTVIGQYYTDFIPIIVIAAIIAFLLAPLSAIIAKRYGFIDLPKKLRKSDERGRDTKIHAKPTPKLGGLAVITTLIIMGAYSYIDLPFITLPQAIAIACASLIVIALTLIDIKKNLSGLTQFSVMTIAALLVVMSGIRFTEITLLNIALDQFTLQLGPHFSLMLPADILNVFWMLLITNAINWLFSVDAVGELIVIVGLVGLLLANVKLGNLPLAFICAIFLGSMLGYTPFNLPPAKMFSGTENVYGFFIALLAILSDGKLLIASGILILPILDMLWVLTFRIKNNKTLNPKRLLQISDTTHIAHRLRDLGFSVPFIIIIEVGIVITSVAIALAVLDFARASFIFLQAAIVLIIFIAIEAIRYQNTKKIKSR
jgi:UDP-GlcNAc:undecaprenyl-phosphate/decaprenyl-phosphate GlcNAc-1-phosphate transferase